VAVIALASAKGSPGVTTTALALTLLWPRPALYVEADIAGSTVIPGLLQGQVDAEKGLRDLAISYATKGDLSDLWQQTYHPQQAANLPWKALSGLDGVNETKALLPGIAGPQMSPILREVWRPLAAHLVSLERGGVDVIVDLGRISAGRDERDPLIAAADLVLLTTRSTLANIAVTVQLHAERAQGQDASARELSNLGLLVVGPGQPHSVAEISRLTELSPLSETIAADGPAADVLANGAPAGKFTRSALVRSIPPTISAIQARVAARRARLDAPVGARS